MTKVVTTQGNLFIIVAIEHERSIKNYQQVEHHETVFIPITFNTLDEAKEWCDEVKIKNRDYMIFGTWNPLKRGA